MSGVGITRRGLQPSYMNGYDNSGTQVITCTNAGQWYGVQSWTQGPTAGPLELQPHAEGARAVLLSKGAGDYVFWFTLTYSGQTTVVYDWAFFVNSTLSILIDTTSPTVVSGIDKATKNGVLSLSVGDYIDVRVKADTAAATATLVNANVAMVRIGV